MRACAARVVQCRRGSDFGLKSNLLQALVAGAAEIKARTVPSLVPKWCATQSVSNGSLAEIPCSAGINREIMVFCVMTCLVPVHIKPRFPNLFGENRSKFPARITGNLILHIREILHPEQGRRRPITAKCSVTKAASAARIARISWCDEPCISCDMFAQMSF